MDHVDEEIVVVEEEAASDGAVDRTLDRTMVEAFPARSADELLRALPGLHQSAHGGQGKAYQVFLRGFDAEHGTSVAVDLEGIPLNEVNNVHGHGYLDLHVLPDVLVDSVSLHAGVPRGHDGDFAVAGAASYRLGLWREGLATRVGAGTDRSAQASLAWRPPASSEGTFLVAQGTAGQGAGPSRSWRQLKAAAGAEHTAPIGRVRAWILAYDGTFQSPGALREDDLDTLGFYGSYPLSGGGDSRRALGRLGLAGDDPGGSQELVLWGGWRELVLRQNFTGYLFDPVRSDSSVQALDTLQGGGEARTVRRLPVPWGEALFDTGTDLRHDKTDALLAEADEAFRPLVDGSVRSLALQTNLGGWAEVRYRPVPALLLEPGLRIDAFDVRVNDGAPRQATAVLPSPRGRIVVEPLATVELSAGIGRGLQSPEARAVVEGARAPVTVSQIAEAGVGWRLPTGLTLRGAVFRTDLDDELVFDHTVARYVSGGTTRRIGTTVVAEWSPVPAVQVLNDVTWADGRFVVTDTPIPFAPRWLTSHGVFLRQASLGPALVTGGLRVWTMGRRPLPDGFSSRPAFAGDLTGQVEVGRTTLGVELDNALGNRWRDGEFVYPSWWDLDSARSERASLHITSGEPTALRVSVGYRWR